MAGANLEILKFAFYLAVPITIMGYFGNTDTFYKPFVWPERQRFWPDTKEEVPKSPEDIQAAVQKINAQRAQWRATAEAEGLLPKQDA